MLSLKYKGFQYGHCVVGSRQSLCSVELLLLKIGSQLVDSGVSARAIIMIHGG